MNLPIEIIKYLIKHPPLSGGDINIAKRKLCKEYHLSTPPNNAELIQAYYDLKIAKPYLLNILCKRQIRTLSGIAPVAVLTKPYPCPGNCAYCPNEPNMPASYLSNEPAVMRAILCKFDPYRQIHFRLKALKNNGHPIDKLELIVMGGTWSYLPPKYQDWYITECFRAADDFPKYISKRKYLSTDKKLAKQQNRNETARSRIIGLTLETRPDYINATELINMRRLGCTRIEIGIQHLDDKILLLNRRGHNTSTTVKATALMRSFGFKITYHIMLNLPGSTLSKDFGMLQTIFSDPKFQPDQIKLYPCVVVKSATIYNWWQQKKWQAYSTKTLINLLIKIKSITPPWVRIIRVIRDIPEASIIAGNSITNLRQTIQATMAKQKLSCQCIRCREAGHQLKDNNNKKLYKTKLFRRPYKVANGTEYFLSFESTDQKVLYAFCRLYLPNKKSAVPKLLNSQITKLLINSALIRELHTYGQMAPVGQTGTIQHQGMGKKLLAEAEKIAQKQGFAKIAVISGVGVRSYYKKLGYKLQNTYLTKKV